MGVKALKERFGITHIVQMSGARVCIGSGYVSDIVTIDPSTGRVTESSTFAGFLKQHYPALAEAAPEEVARLLVAQDQFADSIPVFTYDGGKIIEKQCEKPGWPNVTHDGDVMYENTYSTDKRQVVQWAKRNARAGISIITRSIADTETRLAEQREELAKCENDLAELDAAFPELVAAD